ncbi:unnamed protein product [Owenia fusiformis]|nr:unnamed protein product [Owenia fusiformis]
MATAYYSASPMMRHPGVSQSPRTPSFTNTYPIVTDKTISSHMSKNLGHAKTYYNPARNVLYSRYTQNDWANSNRGHYNLSDRERAAAESIRADAWRTVKECDARTRNRQFSNTRKLGERTQDIAFWKQELHSEMDAMQNEIENLREHKRVLEKALMDSNNPLHIAEECCMHREKRQGIDLVNDDVERQLSREVGTIRKCQDRMKRLVEKASIQLKLDRAVLHDLDQDSKDKNHAQNLDDRMHGLRNTSAGVGYHPGIENVDHTITIPYSWVKYTQENIARSQKMRAASERLRGEIDACLRACANEMWSQFNSVNNSFNSRLQETSDARNKLQAHLQRTMQEIFDMERNIDILRKAIADKELPMKVAQTRLEERTRRINVEMCNDPSMKGLQREVHELRESIRFLKEKLWTSEQALARLMKTKSALEHDISVKENSLAIDGKACMGMRKGFPMEPKQGPIFSMPVTY